MDRATLIRNLGKDDICNRNIEKMENRQTTAETNVSYLTSTVVEVASMVVQNEVLDEGVQGSFEEMAWDYLI